jgi:predicted lipase
MLASYSQVLSAVKIARKPFPDYEIIVTGHSLGAALATLTTLELQHAGNTNLRTIHFGSPRVGNTNFANWATTALGARSARNTHHKDMVPHCPTHERFTHIGGEFYEDPVLQLRTCVGLEDPNCSYQWHITSVDDHMLYLNKALGGEGCV